MTPFLEITDKVDGKKLIIDIVDNKVITSGELEPNRAKEIMQEIADVTVRCQTAINNAFNSYKHRDIIDVLKEDGSVEKMEWRWPEDTSQNSLPIIPMSIMDEESGQCVHDHFLVGQSCDFCSYVKTTKTSDNK